MYRYAVRTEDVFCIVRGPNEGVKFGKNEDKVQPRDDGLRMAVTLAERRAALLRKLGRSLEEVRLNFEALTPQAVACLKTEKGYELVSAPKGLNKLFYARTSGKECGQRQLGNKASRQQSWQRGRYSKRSCLRNQQIEISRWLEPGKSAGNRNQRDISMRRASGAKKILAISARNLEIGWLAQKWRFLSQDLLL